MEETLVPIFICVVLPVAIVAITGWTKINNDNKRTQVLIKAIEANKDIDADKLAEALSKPRKSPKEILYGRLLKGCLFTLVGVACEIFALVSYISHDAGTSMDAITFPTIAGGISLAIGISFLVVYFVTRRQTQDTEEK